MLNLLQGTREELNFDANGGERWYVDILDREQIRQNIGEVGTQGNFQREQGNKGTSLSSILRLSSSFNLKKNRNTAATQALTRTHSGMRKRNEALL